MLRSIACSGHLVAAMSCEALVVVSPGLVDFVRFHDGTLIRRMNTPRVRQSTGLTIHDADTIVIANAGKRADLDCYKMTTGLCNFRKKK